MVCRDQAVAIAALSSRVVVTAFEPIVSPTMTTISKESPFRAVRAARPVRSQLGAVLLWAVNRTDVAVNHYRLFVSYEPNTAALSAAGAPGLSTSSCCNWSSTCSKPWLRLEDFVEPQLSDGHGSLLPWCAQLSVPPGLAMLMVDGEPKPIFTESLRLHFSRKTSVRWKVLEALWRA